MLYLLLLFKFIIWSLFPNYNRRGKKPSSFLGVVLKSDSQFILAAQIEFVWSILCNPTGISLLCIRCNSWSGGHLPYMKSTQIWSKEPCMVLWAPLGVINESRARSKPLSAANYNPRTKKPEGLLKDFGVFFFLSWVKKLRPQIDNLPKYDS